MREEDPWLTTDAIAAATGKGVRILIVDSGVETSHPVFEGREIESFCLDETCVPVRVQQEASGSDAFGHGTAVASILQAHVPAATLASLRVLGGDLRSHSEHVVAGVEWGIDRGFDVINCSFGSSSDQHLRAYKRLVDRAFCRGTILVSACNNVDYRKTDYPASFPTVISTDYAAMDADQIGRRAGQLVEFVANGRDVPVAWRDGGYRKNTGSSFAAPHVAALVAKIRELRPRWNACDVKAQLYRVAGEGLVG